MPDILINRVDNLSVMLEVGSIHGMLWLQTHFEDDDWEALSRGAVGLLNDDATRLSQDASLAGLLVRYPSIP